jgi:hypothetical protein
MLIQIGHSWMEHPSQCGYGLPGGDDSLVTD